MSVQAFPLRASRGRATTIVLWALQLLAAVAFLASGGAKLASVPMMIEIFDKIGIGQWFRYVTGIVEVGSGLALLFPATAVVGALLLAITMACAVLAHLFILGGSPAPPLVLLVVTGTIVWLRRDDLAAWLGRR